MKRPRAAFTLIEIMLALAIFAILAGAVFLSVQAVSNASAVIGVEQMRARKIDAFLSWCRRGFRSVSSRSEMTLRTRDTGSAGRAVELILRRAPGAFPLGEADAAGGDLILAAIPDGKGTAVFSIARFPGTWTLEDVEKQLTPQDWFPLLEGLRTLQWGFWDPASGDFVDILPEGSPLPELVRLRMSLDTGEEIEAIFRPPKLTARGEWQRAGEDDENRPPSQEGEE